MWEGEKEGGIERDRKGGRKRERGREEERGRERGRGRGRGRERKRERESESMMRSCGFSHNNHKLFTLFFPKEPHRLVYFGPVGLTRSSCSNGLLDGDVLNGDSLKWPS